jgi:Flp pilus assembly protein TadD
MDCWVAIVLLAIASVRSTGQPAGENLAEEARKLSAAGDYKEAVKIYQLLAAREPRSVSVFINLGVAYAKLGQFSLAARAYRTALGIDPKSVPALIDLGVAEFKAGRFGNAIDPLETAIHLDPSNRQAQTLLAMSHFSLHQFEPAARYFEPCSRVTRPTAPYNTCLVSATSAHINSSAWKHSSRRSRNHLRIPWPCTCSPARRTIG